MDDWMILLLMGGVVVLGFAMVGPQGVAINPTLYPGLPPSFAEDSNGNCLFGNCPPKN